ncbi:MAG: hypothetical protein DWQ47_10785 [Acidobacteria bacterium]|nr:MAG: hypothetical protein DWQ32_13200 [Acidobacteriota bacterium]REJ98070.1 MAG: hypothetical protein DWQ38_16000 [Acidobacteriota bacterium]REK16813.1 MAG: hypothetical protein DWQ43_01045 [Acidobacteriota bacterium]REK42724.1 MAG: hypothetical protein DWQ47_10785 [Acidobacteriota bacterium]
MNVVKIAALLSLFLCLGVSEVSAQNAQFRLGIASASSLLSNKEKFEFSNGNEKVILSASTPVVYFTRKFSAGEAYRVLQLAGARPCDLQGAQQGTFTGTDVLVYANCGSPPLTIFKLEVTGIGIGESFRFSDNYGRTTTLTSSATVNLGGFPQGDDYAVTQTEGKRQCTLAFSHGTVPVTAVTVKAACGSNPPITPAPSKTSFPKFDLVSRSPDDKIVSSFWESFTPVIGGTGPDEGRYVAFVTLTKDLGGSGRFRQIVWRDRKTGDLRLVSIGLNGAEGNQNSTNPSISADGRSVAFESYATNLVPVDTNSVRDVFVWNADTNKVSAVSENAGVEANNEAFEPAISGDGSLVAFSSSAGNLAPGVEGTSTVNVFLRDMRNGSVTLISKSEKTGKAGGGSRPSISEDGTRIAFHNYFSLTNDDKNDLWDIYVWERGNQKLKRISKTSSGAEKDQGIESASRVVAPSISGNGKFVAYSSTATNLVPGDTNGLQDVFVVEIDSGRLIWASTGNGSVQGNGDTPIGQGERAAISYDGKWLAISSSSTNLGGNILLKNLITGEFRAVSVDTGSTVGQPEISRDGNYVVFGTSQKLDDRFTSSGIFAVFVGPDVVN